MPIFDFRCKQCNNIQEVLTTSISQVPVTKCEECGCDDMEKLVSGKLTFQLIGEGWASDNYQYNYTKSKAGTEDKVKPVYDRKKAKELLKKYKDNTFDTFKHEEIK